MPFVANEGAEIYWEEHGRGTPVLLIMGLSFTLEMWFRLLPVLANSYRVLLFDNRGMGRSSVPRAPYTIARMARDAAAVLRAAAIPSAHVVGASMGGMIAQEFALQYPGMVKTLTLGCTTHSGLFGHWPELRYARRDEFWVKLLYAETTPRERIAEDFAVRSRCRWTAEGFRRQLAAILLWSAYRRLPSITQPTLVVHGDGDRLIPSANGQVLAARIPNARFELIRNAGHMITTDQPEHCFALVRSFLNGGADDRNAAEPSATYT